MFSWDIGFILVRWVLNNATYVLQWQRTSCVRVTCNAWKNALWPVQGGWPLIEVKLYSAPWASRPWITLTLSSDALSVSAFIVPTENNPFNGLFIQIWSPLGSSLLVTNERAFLTISILEIVRNKTDTIVYLLLFSHDMKRRHCNLFIFILFFLKGP